MNQTLQTTSENEIDEYENPILFWQRQLDVNIPFLEIPADFPRSTNSYQIEHISFSLSASCQNGLKQLSKQFDTTLFTTLLAAYNTLLFRYTRQEDIIIGFPTLENLFNKNGELIGIHHNTKIFRTDLSANPSFTDLLKRVHQVVLIANKYKGVSHESLEADMKLKLGANYTGLYNVIFSFGNIGFENNEWTSNISVPENSRSTIDLALYIEETVQGLNVVWTYNSVLFEDIAIRRIAKHFEVLLAAIVINPQHAISQLQLLTDTEKHQLTLIWNSSKNYPINKCLHKLFEEQVNKTPEAIALVFEKKELTYAELNNRSNQLAHYLRDRGVKEEIIVPICIGRSFEMIIGILGILKAGGAYVPIDPNYPLERIGYMLEDTNASLVICDKESKTRLTTFQNIDRIELTEKSFFLKSQQIDNLNIDLSPGNLAYIIYTSGSTGKPKGVMIEHRSLLNYLLNNKTRYVNEGKNNAGSFIHLSYTFDASLTGIFMPLLNGKLIVIGGKQDINIFEDENLLKYAPYDFIKLTPAHISLLQNIIPDADSNPLAHKLVFGGEALRLNYFDYFVEKGIDIEVINEYGPTEATVGCSTYSFNLSDNNKKISNSIPIGKPIDNAHLYILDPDQQLVPVGVKGEIYIGGDGVARGYLNRPGLTAERFIKNPFNDENGVRLYKTGDLGRWLSNGNIEYLGRMDDQVKIRGYRIELGEIESVLEQSGLVRQAVVLAKEDKHGAKRLVGYVVPENTFDIKAIQRYLKDKLPEYMVPALWVALESLPLTSNGKVDKKALPDPDVREQLKNEYVAPGNKTEQMLAGIWQEVLGTKRVGVHDNFFELGGDSIHAVLLFAKIKRKFHKRFPLATILTAPTILQLAVALNEKTELSSSTSCLVPIQLNGSKTPIFAVHAGEGNIVFYHSLSKRLGTNQPFYGLQARGLNGIDRPFSQMEQMASHYISEIRKVQPEGPYYLAGYCLGATIVFEMAQQLTHQGQKVALLANFNGITPTYHPPSDVIGINKKETPREISAKAPYHLNNIAKLSLKEKFLYVPKKIKNRYSGKLKKKLYKLVRLFFKLVHIINAIVYKFCIDHKLKVPSIVAILNIHKSLFVLQCNYKLKAYSGPMVIFRSPGIYKDPYLGWKNFVKGEIKTFDIPGEHKTRRYIMNEPHVQFLAEELQNFLDKD
jgi:amino acid adenylation domain-containing protein